MMGQIRPPEPQKLFVGMLSSSQEIMQTTTQILQNKYGKLDMESNIWSFEYTKYYQKEMGASLFRKFVAFQKLILPDELANVKVYTNALEGEMALAHNFCPRPINLDPGYLSLAKIVLATTKDYSHRLYIGKGIYAEVTLHYTKNSYREYPWTYPDYKTPHYLEFFHELRDNYHQQLLFTKQIV